MDGKKKRVCPDLSMLTDGEIPMTIRKRKANEMEYEQLTITDFLQRQIENRKVMDLTEWINSSGTAQYTQIKELLTEECRRLEITDDEEKIDRLTNAVSCYVLDKSLGYMSYLRKI